MDQYLASGGRQNREWFPHDIPNLMKCSKTEIGDDLEFITANLPLDEQEAAAMAVEGDEEGMQNAPLTYAAASNPHASRSQSQKYAKRKQISRESDKKVEEQRSVHIPHSHT